MIFKRTGPCRILVAAVALGLAGRAHGAGTREAEALRALTGGPARLVWCRDAGDGTDVAAMGSQLLLMGLDTEDGRGERPILPAPCNVAKPSLTLKGDRIVYSDRHTETVYVINWDGSGRRGIGRGFALATWRDPADGRDWVYAGTDVVQLKAPCFKTILRWPIDEPERREVVWNQTIVSQDFQPSGDGRYAASAFPWPACGVAALPNGAWHQFGIGCWPCLAPDNQPWAWIFDGQHRNLYVYNLNAVFDWRLVNLGGAPGVDGFEVYHPRWATDSRFMTLTGPYKAGDSANRIMAGGEHVEIYAGRFAAGYDRIDAWARVTSNRQADFYPHLWLPPPDGPWPGLSVKALSLPDDPPGTVWPGYSEGLQFVWDQRRRKNEIHLPEGATRVCRVEPRGLARYGRGFEMRLGRGPFSVESGDEGILDACMASTEMSLEAILTPDPEQPDGETPLCTFGGANAVDFELAHKDAQLTVRLRAEGRLQEAVVGRMRPGPNHLILSYAPGRLVAYLEGRPAASSDAVTGPLSGWSPGRLRFGAPNDRGQFWSGRMEAVAWYSRWITAREAALHAQLARRRPDPGPPPARCVVRARLIEAGSMPTPAGIAPYRRGLLAGLYELESVEEGDAPLPRRFLAAHWVIMDARPLPSAARTAGESYTMPLEPYEDHPELEGERLIMDVEDLTLPLFFDVGS